MYSEAAVLGFVCKPSGCSDLARELTVNGHISRTVRLLAVVKVGESVAPFR